MSHHCEWERRWASAVTGANPAGTTSIAQARRHPRGLTMRLAADLDREQRLDLLRALGLSSNLIPARVAWLAAATGRAKRCEAIHLARRFRAPQALHRGVTPASPTRRRSWQCLIGRRLAVRSAVLRAQRGPARRHQPLPRWWRSSMMPGALWSAKQVVSQ